MPRRVAQGLPRRGAVRLIRVSYWPIERLDIKDVDDVIWRASFVHVDLVRVVRPTGIAAPGSEVPRPAAYNERAIKSFMISFVPP